MINVSSLSLGQSLSFFPKKIRNLCPPLFLYAFFEIPTINLSNMFGSKPPILSHNSIYYTFIITLLLLLLLALFSLQLTLYLPPIPIFTFDARITKDPIILFTFGATEMIPIPTIARLPSDRHHIYLHILHLRNAFPLSQFSISDFF